MSVPDEQGARVTEELECVADVLHFLLHELRAADSKRSEEETADHAFFGSTVVGREMMYEIIYLSGLCVYIEHRAVRSSMD